VCDILGTGGVSRHMMSIIQKPTLSARWPPSFGEDMSGRLVANLVTNKGTSGDCRGHRILDASVTC
jgi:hypothetical protein